MNKIYILCFISLFILSSCSVLNRNNSDIDTGGKGGSEIQVDMDTQQYQVGELILDNFGANQTISSPYTITGKAPRYWFFEGVFPVSLMTISGSTIVDSYATGDWLAPVGKKELLEAEDMIDFTSLIEFDVSQDILGEAIIKFSRDNPRGDINTQYVEERVILIDTE